MTRSIPLTLSLLAIFSTTACKTYTKSGDELLFPAGVHQWHRGQDYRNDAPSDDCPGCPEITLTSPSNSELERTGWLFELPDRHTTFTLQGFISNAGVNECGTDNTLGCSNEWRVWPPDAGDSAVNVQTPGGYFGNDDAISINLNPSFQCGTSRLVIVAENTFGLTRLIMDVKRAGGVCEVSEPGETLNIRLNWDSSNTDLDLHLVREGGSFGDPENDCYYDNCKRSGNAMGTSSLDWGEWGNDADNPLLDVDDTNMGGPENIFLFKPEDGTYTIYANYYDSDSVNPPTVLPDVEIRVGSELRNWILYDAYLPELSPGAVWKVATVTVSGDYFTVNEINTAEFGVTN